jgi:hypothetical protein
VRASDGCRCLSYAAEPLVERKSFRSSLTIGSSGGLSLE